jgi:hypothetical protein
MAWGTYAWGTGSWGGGAIVTLPAPGTPPPGGTTIGGTPDPATGSVLVEAHWPGATTLRIVRIVDGVEYPVRGGYPIAMSALPITDREAPLDVVFTYRLTNPDSPGIQLDSSIITLASDGHSWLSAPGSADDPMDTVVLAEPGMHRKIERGVFPVIGRTNPIAVSASTRISSAGELKIMAADFAERDRLWTLLETGVVLLLRAPADLGHGAGEWISVGDVDMESPGHGAWEAPRTFTLPYQVVDPPALS